MSPLELGLILILIPLYISHFAMFYLLFKVRKKIRKLEVDNDVLFTCVQSCQDDVKDLQEEFSPIQNQYQS